MLNKIEGKRTKMKKIVKDLRRKKREEYMKSNKNY